MDVTAPITHRTWSPALVGWTGLAAVLALIAYTLIGAPLDGQRPDPLAFTAAATGLFGAAIAAVLLSRSPWHPIGWLFLVIGVTRGLAGAAQVWCVSALVTHPGWPGGAIASWLQTWLPSIGLAVAPLIVVLFPDGRLPGRAWRVVPWLSGAALVCLAVVFPAGAWQYRGVRLLPDARVPAGRAAEVGNAAFLAGAGLTVVAAVIALTGLLVRARRSPGEVRQQIKWFGYAGVCAFAANILAAVTGTAWFIVLGVTAIFAGIGLGIFRYRLYDVDRLIRRTFAWGALTLVLAGAFASLDITIAVITGRGSVIAAAVAAFAVALLLQPARHRLQDAVDRVYDRRAYNGVRLVRELGRRVGRDTVDPDQVRAVLQIALRDPHLEIFYPVRDGGIVDGLGRPVDLTGKSFLPVRRQGQDIALIVHGPIDVVHRDAVLPAAATALEHARLQAQLRVQLVELRASRGRIVAAGDAERRRIERDLHDGAQQRLVGLAVHIQSARRGAAYPPGVEELLGFTVEQLQAGVDDIRNLVHGILPPALVAGGLPAALAEFADVAVTCDLTARADPGIEAAAWFVICEGVANARKHAPGSRVEVIVGSTIDGLGVEVADDGPGGAHPNGRGLRHLADRVEAHGGTLRVESRSGAGTRLTAELPCG